MVNPNQDKFLKEQRDLKQQYLGGARDNRTERTSDPEYNNKNDTDISVGATGREVE
ncbi:hypothetical protein WMO40_05450 [Bacillaceae bacterium CLA-AA-H227]|uniref:Uncharacterized protein n=1 Tax=Robertmurraya yapensis (ex Hitch et al 2024) TaxID=3133160 RepID=A0ACC6S7V9_9BACI|nr:hypothetical protein [Bacillus yapensis]